MKQIRVLIFLIICGSSIRTGLAQFQASDSDNPEAHHEYPIEYSGVLKTNPLSILWGTIPLSAEYMVLYEFVSAPQQASQIGISYISKSPILSAFEDSIQDLKQLTINGVRIQLSHRFYILNFYDYAPRGLYIGPQLSYATAKLSTKFYNSRDVYLRITQFNANLLVGWQWIFRNDYTIDVFGGLGYKDNIWEEHDSQSTIVVDTDELGDWYSGPVKISIGFHLGIAF